MFVAVVRIDPVKVRSGTCVVVGECLLQPRRGEDGIVPSTKNKGSLNLLVESVLEVIKKYGFVFSSEKLEHFNLYGELPRGVFDA